MSGYHRLRMLVGLLLAAQALAAYTSASGLAHHFKQATKLA